MTEYTKKIEKWLVSVDPRYIALAVLAGPAFLQIFYIALAEIIGVLSIVAFFASLVLLWDEAKRKIEEAEAIPPPQEFGKLKDLLHGAEMAKAKQKERKVKQEEKEQAKSKYVVGLEIDISGNIIETLNKELIEEKKAEIAAMDRLTPSKK